MLPLFEALCVNLDREKPQLMKTSALLLVLLNQQSNTDVLLTEDYQLEIHQLCAEVESNCEKLSLTIIERGKSKIKDTARGKSVRLTSTIRKNSLCETFIYEFTSGAITYYICEENRFEVYLDAKHDPFYSKEGVWNGT